MQKRFLLGPIEVYQENISKAIFQKYVIVSIEGFGVGKCFIAYCLLVLRQAP